MQITTINLKIISRNGKITTINLKITSRNGKITSRNENIIPTLLQDSPKPRGWGGSKVIWGVTSLLAFESFQIQVNRDQVCKSYILKVFDTCTNNLFSTHSSTFFIKLAPCSQKRGQTEKTLL